MNFCFIALENVLHPEDHSCVMEFGQVYTQEEILSISEETGIDNVKVQLVIAWVGETKNMMLIRARCFAAHFIEHDAAE